MLERSIGSRRRQTDTSRPSWLAIRGDGGEEGGVASAWTDPIGLLDRRTRATSAFSSSNGSSERSPSGDHRPLSAAAGEEALDAIEDLELGLQGDLECEDELGCPGDVELRRGAHVAPCDERDEERKGRGDGRVPVLAALWERQDARLGERVEPLAQLGARVGGGSP